MAKRQGASGTTTDEIFRGELVLEQPRRGYRFNLDAVLLASFTHEVVGSPPERIIDLGCGCGIVGLTLARRWPTARVRLVELQAAMSELARRNAERNQLADRVEVIQGDLTAVVSWQPDSGERTLVVSNPPFWPTSAGRVSPNPDIAMARHELRCSLDQLIDSCAQVRGTGQLLALIHDVARRDELMQRLDQAGYQLRRVRAVLPMPGRPARRVLVLARRRQKACDLEPVTEDEPLVVHERPGVYSPRMREILED